MNTENMQAQPINMAEDLDIFQRFEKCLKENDIKEIDYSEINKKKMAVSRKKEKETYALRKFLSFLEGSFWVSWLVFVLGLFFSALFGVVLVFGSWLNPEWAKEYAENVSFIFFAVVVISGILTSLSHFLYKKLEWKVRPIYWGRFHVEDFNEDNIPEHFKKIIKVLSGIETKAGENIRVHILQMCDPSQKNALVDRMILCVELAKLKKLHKRYYPINIKHCSSEHYLATHNL